MKPRRHNPGDRVHQELEPREAQWLPGTVRAAIEALDEAVNNRVGTVDVRECRPHATAQQHGGHRFTQPTIVVEVWLFLTFGPNRDQADHSALKALDTLKAEGASHCPRTQSGTLYYPPCSCWASP